MAPERVVRLRFETPRTLWVAQGAGGSTALRDVRRLNGRVAGVSADTLSLRVHDPDAHRTGTTRVVPDAVL